MVTIYKMPRFINNLILLYNLTNLNTFKLHREWLGQNEVKVTNDPFFTPLTAVSIQNTIYIYRYLHKHNTCSRKRSELFLKKLFYEYIERPIFYFCLTHSLINMIRTSCNNCSQKNKDFRVKKYLTLCNVTSPCTRTYW